MLALSWWKFLPKENQHFYNMRTDNLSLELDINYEIKYEALKWSICSQRGIKFIFHTAVLCNSFKCVTIVNVKSPYKKINGSIQMFNTYELLLSWIAVHTVICISQLVGVYICHNPAVFYSHNSKRLWQQHQRNTFFTQAQHDKTINHHFIVQLNAFQKG